MRNGPETDITKDTVECCRTGTECDQALQAQLNVRVAVQSMLNKVYPLTVAEVRGYFLRRLPKLTGVERARWERCMESLAAFERGARNSTHRASTTLH